MKAPKISAWWTADKDDVADKLTSHARLLYDADTSRREEIRMNCLRWGLSLSGLRAVTTLTTVTDTDLRLNIIKSVTETIQAKIGSNRPRPYVLTDGADYELKTKAKELQRFLDGAYQASGIYTLAADVFRDAMIAKTGVFGFKPVYHEDGPCIAAQRVFPLEILVDPNEAADGDPDTIYRVYFESKERLRVLFPKFREEIELATMQDPDGSMADDLGNGLEDPRMVLVCEGWKRANYDFEGTCHAGRHVMAVGTAALVDEEWEHDYFPFEFFHWCRPVRGFWGGAAVSEIRPIEREVNLLLQRVQEAMRLLGNPWVLKHKDSGVEAKKLTNRPGDVIEWDGQPGQEPKVVTHQAIGADVLNQTWTLYGKAFEIVGTNQLQAAAVKPPGVESGRALEQLGEEHTVRFKHVSQHFEQIVAVGCARQFLRLAKRLNEVVPGGFKIKSRSGKQMIRLKWDDVAMSPDDFFLDVYPTALLPALPSGKIAEVERLMQAGIITPQQGRQLLDFPDLASTMDPIMAAQNLLERQLSEMLDNGNVQVPDEWQDPNACLQYAVTQYLMAQLESVPEARLDLVRNYMSVCEQRIAAAMPPAPPPGMPTMDGAMMAPPGMGPPAPAPEDMGMGGPPMPGGPPGLPPEQMM